MKKMLFIAPKTATFLNFRGQLMKDIVDNGYEVVAIVPEDTHDDEFKKINVRKIILNFNKTSISPIATLKYYFSLKKIIKKEQPDKIFAYTIKPVIFGSIAGHKSKVREIYSLVCGLGMVYSVDNLKTKIIRPICNLAYKIAFKYNEKVIFQNKDDVNEFVNRRIIDNEKCEVVNGSGVDLNVFKKNELPNNDSFIMVSRIINEKGFKEFFKAASMIKTKYSNAKFTYIGAYDKSYKKDFELLKPYIEQGIVEYIPETDKVQEYLSKHAIFVLPSYYREGIPKTLLEATAMGRPIITTNTPGCRETIIEGENGYFVKTRNVDDLVEKMEKMINENDLQSFGDKSYELCLKKFDIKIINKQMIKIMRV